MRNMHWLSRATTCAAISAALCATTANAQIVEGFDLGTIPPAGWAVQNLSSPVGTTGWLNGATGAVFPAQAGANFIAANFNNTTGTNTISNWLFSPATTLSANSVIKFWTRNPSTTFPDRLQVRLSLNGASTNAGATATSVGDFSTLLLDINPTYLGAGGYPIVWTEYTINLTAAQVPAPTQGRIAFRYFVENGGPTGANSNYIGIDTFSFTPPANPCADPLPAVCAANVSVAGASATQVDVSDLLTVITNWGSTAPPLPGRPVGDCAPLPNGDCTVNVTDLLAVITSWGSCLPATGSCCNLGSCTVLTQADCAAAGGTWGAPNSTCAGVSCPTANDECVGALTLATGVSPAAAAANNGSNAGATKSTTLPNPTCPSSFSRDVWYKHVVPNTPGLIGQTMRLSLCDTTGALSDTFLQVYTGTCASLVAVACNDDSCGLRSEVDTAMIPAGTTVYIRLGSWGTSAGNQGPFVLTSLVTNISSDFCSGAKMLAIGGSDTDVLDNSTSDFGPSCSAPLTTSCAPNPTPFAVSAGVGRWYKTVGNGQILTASTCTSASAVYDGRISVYCGPDCGSLFCVQSVDCDTGQAQLPACTAFQGESVSWCSTLGQDYYILVHAANVPSGQSNPFTITLTGGAACSPTGIVCGPPPPPENDECAGAITIPVGATNFNNATALPPSTAPIPWCGTTGSKDVYFKYTSANGGTVKIVVTGTAPYTDGIATVYTGACGALVQVICVDDPVTGGTCTGCGACHPCIEFTATAGTTYTIQVGSWGGSGGGAGTITITDP